MKLAQISVNRPVTTLMIFVAMVVLGLVSMSMLGLDLMPELEIPSVSVITAYEGAGPEEIETLITEPMEDTLSTISGVDEVISISKEGMSTVTLRFEWGEKIDESINDVRERIDLIRERLPEEAGNPIIFKFDLSMIPIAIITFTAEESYPDLQDIESRIVMDSSEFILASVGTLRDTVFWAVFFVFIVHLFFLRDFRASLIVAVAIPTSLIITFLLMYLAGYTINTDSLATLAVASSAYFHAATHKQDVNDFADADRWWERFGDSTTAQLVRRALENNAALQSI
jgi:multidrug efflux pump subunit AcrB